MSNVSDARWWLDDYKDERHRKVINWTLAIRNRQERWRKRDLLHACLYGNMEILGFGPSNFWKFGNDDGRLTWNIVKPKVDTWVSMICRSKPEAMFLPTGSGASAQEMWTLRRQCREMERFCNGKLDQCKFHDDIAPLAVLDVGIFDYGLAKVSISCVDDAKADWKRADVCIERAYPHQIIINDAEAMNGNPRSMAQRFPVDRYVLAEKFPNKRAEVLDSPKGFKADEGGVNEEDSDVVCVTEIWHLPSTEDSNDGRHCLVTENCTLIDEKFDMCRFPFARLTQMPVPMGIRGQSIAHQLRPIQVAVNQLLLDFQDAVHTMARPMWLIPNQSGSDKAHYDDQVGSQIWYDAPYKPEAWSPQTLPPDAYKFLMDQDAMADKVIGISAYRSAGIVPSNLKSGKAQEVANDTQDGRFLISSRLFESWCMDVVDLVIHKSKIIAEKRPDYASRYINGKNATMVEFREIKLEREQYALTCYSASALANTPAARYDQLADMLAKGIIDMPTYRKLFDFPDVAGELRQLNAPQDLADMLVERYLNAKDTEADDLYIAPEARWPIQILYQKFLYATVDAQTNGCPDANIALMNKFMDDLESRAADIGLQLPGMPAPNAGPANTGAPLGQPGGAPSAAPIMPMPGANGAAPPAPPPPPGPNGAPS